MADEVSLFNSDSTVAKSSADIVRLLFLQRLDDLLRAEKRVYNTLEASGSYPVAVRDLRACLRSLFRLCSPRMSKREKIKKDYEYSISKFNEAIFDDKKLFELVGFLVDYLELDMKITDISKVQDYDRTNVIFSNRVKGYK